MSPEMSIDRVRSFIRWNGSRFHVLDEEHEPIADPVGWRRGQGEKLEYWIKPKAWREIFENDRVLAMDASLEWQPAADVALRRLKQKQPQAPDFPANFAELTPEQKQNYLLAHAMYLQARLLSSGLAHDPQDTKAIAQLANLAQGIVKTSVELEQLRADRNKMDPVREEKIRVLINRMRDYRDTHQDEKKPKYLVPRGLE